MESGADARLVQAGNEGVSIAVLVFDQFATDQRAVSKVVNQGVTPGFERVRFVTAGSGLADFRIF
jgi:hypothetical protein